MACYVWLVAFIITHNRYPISMSVECGCLKEMGILQQIMVWELVMEPKSLSVTDTLRENVIIKLNMTKVVAIGL